MLTAPCSKQALKFESIAPDQAEACGRGADLSHRTSSRRSIDSNNGLRSPLQWSLITQIRIRSALGFPKGDCSVPGLPLPDLYE